MILKFTELKVKFLINVHAPHMGTTTRNMEVTEEICRKLNNIDKYLKGKNLIHLGDFNANVEKVSGILSASAFTRNFSSFHNNHRLLHNLLVNTLVIQDGSWEVSRSFWWVFTRFAGFVHFGSDLIIATNSRITLVGVSRLIVCTT